MPDDLKEIYRTAWELEPFVTVDMAADRAPYIDQSQSLSLYIDAPSTALLVSTPLPCRAVYEHRLILLLPDATPEPGMGEGPQDRDLLPPNQTSRLADPIRFAVC